LERLTYFHANHILIELNQQETEIRCRKDDGPIKKYTDIDHHGPVPYSISRQTPDPPRFSLPTTFNPSHFSLSTTFKEISFYKENIKV
jgi:hypothetical protein